MMCVDEKISVWDGHVSGIFLHSPVFSHAGCRPVFSKPYISNFELVNHGQYIISLSSKPNLWESWQPREAGTLVFSHFKAEKIQRSAAFFFFFLVFCFVYLNIALGACWFPCWCTCFRICPGHLAQHCSCVTEAEGTIVITTNICLQTLPDSNTGCWRPEWLHIESMLGKLPSFGQSLILLVLMVKSI